MIPLFLLFVIIAITIFGIWGMPRKVRSVDFDRRKVLHLAISLLQSIDE